MITHADTTHFTFHAHVRLSRGDNGLALHDLFGPRLLWVREAALASAVSLVSIGRPVAQAAAEADVERDELERHLRSFEALGLGVFRGSRVGVEPFRPVILRSQSEQQGVVRRGGRATIEISDRCVYDCRWCSSRTTATAEACACGVWPREGDALSIERLVAAIEELHEAGSAKLEIRGGEPFLEPDRLSALVETAARFGMGLEIHTTGQLLDEEWAQRLAAASAEVVLLAIAEQPEEFDIEARCPGSHEAFVGAVDRLAAAGIPFAVKVPVDVTDLPTGKRAVGWARRIGAESVLILYHAAGSAQPDAVLRDALALRSPQAFVADVESFHVNGESQFCLADSHTIAFDGRVLPCIGWRHELADLREVDMDVFLREERASEIQQMSRDRVSACGGCEFRFGCRACLVRTLDRAGKIDSRHWNCAYDPSAGAWG